MYIFCFYNDLSLCVVQSKFSILILTSIAYCLDFVDIIIVNDVIKCGVELVEEVHDLVRCAGTRQLSKADDITVTEE